MEETKEVEIVFADEPAYISIEGIFGYDSASETENDDLLVEKGIKRECTSRKPKGSYYEDEDWVPYNAKSPDEVANVIIGPSPTPTVTVEEEVDELVPLNTKQLNRLAAMGVFPIPSGGIGSVNASLFNPLTVKWLMENFETVEDCSLPRYLVYNHYLLHCKSLDIIPNNAASFGKVIRSVFLGLQTRRLGTRGNSKYHYCGMRIKPDSPLLNVTVSDCDNKKSTKEGGAKKSSKKALLKKNNHCRKNWTQERFVTWWQKYIQDLPELDDWEQFLLQSSNKIDADDDNCDEPDEKRPKMSGKENSFDDEECRRYFSSSGYVTTYFSSDPVHLDIDTEFVGVDDNNKNNCHEGDNETMTSSGFGFSLNES